MSGVRGESAVAARPVPLSSEVRRRDLDRVFSQDRCSVEIGGREASAPTVTGEGEYQSGRVEQTELEMPRFTACTNSNPFEWRS